MKRFWITREDYERAYYQCDLGDSAEVRIYFWPHKDQINRDDCYRLIECSPIDPGPEPVEYIKCPKCGENMVAGNPEKPCSDCVIESDFRPVEKDEK